MNRWITRAIQVAMVAVAALGVFGFIVMGLWNWLMPPLFGLRQITFWQALGLVILSKIFFGSFRTRGGGGGRWRGRMRERWEEMTPEEREKFRQGIGGFCRPASPDPKV